MRIQEFDYSVNLLQSILWQYENATNIRGLLEEKQEWYNVNQSDFWSNWYTDVFDLRTANAFGLSIWSIILNLPLFSNNEPLPEDAQIWGFNDYTGAPINTYYNYENGTFAPDGGGISLTVEEQRFVLRLRYFQLVTRGAIPEINSFLNYLTTTSDIDPNGTIYALDNFDMTMTYVFDFNITYPLRQVLVQYDLLPRPAGVGIEYVVTYGQIWGFNNFIGGPDNDYFNYENGTFVPDSFI